MLIWSLILPLKITFVVSIIFAILAFVFFWCRSKNVTRSLVRSTIITAIAVIPIFLIVMPVVDSYRFRTSFYKSAKNIDDKFLKWFLPQSAKRIQIETRSNKNTVWYEVKVAALRKFAKKLRQKYGSNSPDSAPSEVMCSGTIERGKPVQFADNQIVAKPGSNNIIVFRTCYDSGGGEFVILYDQKTKLAFHEFYYW